MIQVGDLVKHKHLGGLGLVKRVDTVVKSNRVRTTNVNQAKIQWLIDPDDCGDGRPRIVLWTKLLVKSETK
jgi:hypothetical protein